MRSVGRFRPDGVRPLYRLVTPPSGLIVPVARVKLQCKIEDDEHDSLIEDIWIPTATDFVETLANRVLLTQTWEATFHKFPASGESLDLWPGPVQSIESIAYKDEAGSGATFGTYDTGSPPSIVEYFLQKDSVSPFAALNMDQEWPATAQVLNAVAVRMISGYGTASDVPAKYIHGVLLLCAHFNENREAVSELKLEDIPMGIRNFLAAPKIG